MGLGILAGPAQEWLTSNPETPAYGKENEGDREHFGGIPVSKTIECSGHPVSNQCSVSRALRGSIDFPAAVNGCWEGVVATHGWAFGPAQIWRMPGAHGLR